MFKNFLIKAHTHPWTHIPVHTCTLLSSLVTFYIINKCFTQPTTSWTNCYHFLLPLKECWHGESVLKYEFMFIFLEEWSQCLLGQVPFIGAGDWGWGTVGPKIPDWANLHPRTNQTQWEVILISWFFLHYENGRLYISKWYTMHIRFCNEINFHISFLELL